MTAPYPVMGCACSACRMSDGSLCGPDPCATPGATAHTMQVLPAPPAAAGPDLSTVVAGVAFLVEGQRRPIECNASDIAFSTFKTYCPEHSHRFVDAPSPDTNIDISSLKRFIPTTAFRYEMYTQKAANLLFPALCKLVGAPVMTRPGKQGYLHTEKKTCMVNGQPRQVLFKADSLFSATTESFHFYSSTFLVVELKAHLCNDATTLQNYQTQVLLELMVYRRASKVDGNLTGVLTDLISWWFCTLDSSWSVVWAKHAVTSDTALRHLYTLLRNAPRVPEVTQQQLYSKSDHQDCKDGKDAGDDDESDSDANKKRPRSTPKSSMSGGSGGKAGGSEGKAGEAKGTRSSSRRAGGSYQASGLSQLPGIRSPFPEHKRCVKPRCLSLEEAFQSVLQDVQEMDSSMLPLLLSF
eukprot:gnl/Hemi2/18675_TR6185_c0_g1_i2.p1 gnl/Hemi2/18675_TR6185_c0_g1~~gnl/Hemi2/18675_TR6185_c0_g1_i2.p1  ORF type:complete len:410 (+),score=74.77 gnl/Hemi2/18675_TR6185_c0_g1_i2:157-1386(+)